MLGNPIDTSAALFVPPTLGQWAAILLGITGCVTGVVALVISRYGILPDIEFRYELKELASNYQKYHISEYFLNRFNGRYKSIYSHLLLFNGGNGKASNINVAFNWIVDGEIGGVSENAIEKDGFQLLHYDYLFPGEKESSVPALDFGSNVFEEANNLLIRVRYKGPLGSNHCKCADFVPVSGKREFHIVQHRSCGYIKRCFLTLIRRCSFREDACNTEQIIQIPEEDKEAFEKSQEEEKRNEKK